MVAAHQAVAMPRLRNNGHARLSQRGDIPIDRAHADFIVLGDLLGSDRPVALQQQDDPGQAVDAVHGAAPIGRDSRIFGKTEITPLRVQYSSTWPFSISPVSKLSVNGQSD